MSGDLKFFLCYHLLAIIGVFIHYKTIRISISILCDSSVSLGKRLLFPAIIITPIIIIIKQKGLQWLFLPFIGFPYFQNNDPMEEIGWIVVPVLWIIGVLYLQKKQSDYIRSFIFMGLSLFILYKTIF